MRPLLTLVCAQLGEPERALDEQVITAATAVELTHLASLYHDDVMDSAPTRRGVPSAQRLWGNNRAILAGDILFARASLLVAARGPEIVAHHARTFERLCEGQLNETFGPTDDTDRVDFYLQVLADKTGSLVSTAASFGALLSGAGQLMADVVSDFGEKVGVAFQIADDVRAEIGAPVLTGIVVDYSAAMDTLIAQASAGEKAPAEPGPPGSGRPGFTGLPFNPVTQQYRLNPNDVGVNYMASFRKPQ